MHRISSSASHYKNVSVSSRRSKEATSFSGGNARELILKERSEMGQKTSFNVSVDDDSDARYSGVTACQVLAHLCRPCTGLACKVTVFKAFFNESVNEY